MSEDAGINNERLEKLAYGGEALKPQEPSSLASATGSASGKDSESAHKHVDMWDRPSSDPDTVSNQVRRLTTQWGLPQPTAEGKTPNS